MPAPITHAGHHIVGIIPTPVIPFCHFASPFYYWWCGQDFNLDRRIIAGHVCGMASFLQPVTGTPARTKPVLWPGIFGHQCLLTPPHQYPYLHQTI